MNVQYTPESWNHLRLEFTDEYLKKKKKYIKNNPQILVKSGKTLPKISEQKKSSLKKNNSDTEKCITKSNIKCVIL